MKRALLGVLFLVAFLAAPAIADMGTVALSGEAKVHYDLGVAAYAARDYEIAILEFRSAHHIDPRPELLFAWAQAERLSGDCPSAVLLYRRFLAAHPDSAHAQAAQLPLLRCEQALESRPQGAISPEAVHDPAPAAPAPFAVTRQGLPRPTPWFRDVLGGALLGAGVVGAAIGAGYALTALKTRAEAREAYTYEESRVLAEKAASQRIKAGILLAVGGAVGVAGVVRYVLVAGENEAPSVTMTLSANSEGAALVCAGSY